MDPYNSEDTGFENVNLAVGVVVQLLETHYGASPVVRTRPQSGRTYYWLQGQIGIPGNPDILSIWIIDGTDPIARFQSANKL